MKIITTYQINKIANRMLSIFEEEENGDYCNWNAVRCHERAIEHWMKPYSKEEQRELYDNINWQHTCEMDIEILEKLGWEVISRPKEQENFIKKYIRKKELGL